MPTIRTITLADSENAPTITATCNDTGWNGFHVPHLSFEELRAHYAALAANDSNGTWDEVGVEELSPEESTTAHGVIVMWDDLQDDHMSWELDETGRAWIDGLVWSDPY